MLNAHDCLGFCVARLRLWLSAQSTDYKITVPKGHHKFLKNEYVGEFSISEHDLIIQFSGEPLPGRNTQGIPLCRTNIWELWQDKDSNYVFKAVRESSLKQLIISQDFKQGQLFTANLQISESGSYPFEDLDNILFVNWLANYGDIMLHASGIVVDNKSYAFVGPAGIGKSTIVKTLSMQSSVTVIGEDTIILRHVDNEFWAYGTPWHLNPEMCSPLGAPVERLYFLERNPVEQVLKLSPQEGISRILQTAFIPYYRSELMPRILEMLTILAEAVPFYSLSYDLGSDVWQVINER